MQRSKPDSDSGCLPRACALQSIRILFGHRSIGDDILHGLQESGDTMLRIVELGEHAPTPGTLIHFRVGHNGDALSKLTHFASVLREHPYEVALLKLCYVDISSQADVTRIWQQYCKFASALEQCTNTKLGHITVPLRHPPSTLAATVRRWISGPHPEHQRNLARHAFNERMRERFGSTARLFDLAAIQSRGPDGCTRGCNVRGKFAPALCHEYTFDGGHLNALGRRLTARAFQDFLIACTTSP